MAPPNINVVKLDLVNAMFEEVLSGGVAYVLTEESVEELLDYLAFSLEVGVFGNWAIRKVVHLGAQNSKRVGFGVFLEAFEPLFFLDFFVNQETLLSFVIIRVHGLIGVEIVLIFIMLLLLGFCLCN